VDSEDASSKILTLQNTCEHNQKIKFSLRFFLNNSSITISEWMSHYDYSSKKNNNPSDGFAQARNQLGKSGGAKSFLRGAQIFQTMSNNFKLCPTHLSRGAKRFAREASPPFPPGYGPVSNSFKVCPTHFYRGAEKFSTLLRAWFCPIVLRRQASNRWSVENECSFVAVVTGNVSNKCNSVWMFEKKTQLQCLCKV